MSRRILFISRDGGSTQTFIPVVQAIAGGEAPGSPLVISLHASRRALDAAGITSIPLDEESFSADPEGTIRDLLASHRPELVVSGSSPAHGPSPQTPEQYAIQVAKAMGTPTLGIMDTWLQYKERFCETTASDRAAPHLVPDTLCVLDRRCLDDLVALGIPPTRMVITHNPWLDDAVRSTGHPPPPSIERAGGGLNILFVSQPLAEMASIRGWPFTQEEVFQELAASLPRASPGARHRIWVWVHPAEAPGRWAPGPTQPRTDVEAIVTESRGASVLAHVDMVVTSHSTVVYEALHHGTPCVSLRPGGAALAPLITDDLGVSRAFHRPGEFGAFLSHATMDGLRAELRQRREELVQSGIFFNDGRATRRVLQAIDNLN